MRIAVVSDIHGNILALQAVMKHISKRKVEMIYCAGDLVGYAPFPNEVINFFKDYQIPVTLGNYDDAIGNQRIVCGCVYKDERAQVLGEKSIIWTKEHLTEENKEYLRNLPAEIRFLAGKFEVVIVHGSPLKLNEYLYESAGQDYLLELLNLSRCDVLICGHTHIPYHKVLRPGKYVINAGSVGKPKHGDPLAAYVIIDFGETVEVRIQKVAYAVESMAKAVELSGLPNEFAGMLRTGSE